MYPRLPSFAPLQMVCLYSLGVAVCALTYLVKGPTHMYMAIGVAGALLALDLTNNAAINLRTMSRHLRMQLGSVAPMVNGGRRGA
jgi:hypothetical protein